MTQRIQVGDIVRVKGIRSPAMVVLDVGVFTEDPEAVKLYRKEGKMYHGPRTFLDTEVIVCTWFDSDKHIQQTSFKAFLLEKRA